MPNSNLPESELLKAILGPLLEDFQYWFTQARSRLETEQLRSLDAQQQADLLTQVKQAQQEVSAAQGLFRVTHGQAGVDTSVVAQWHKLVTACWQATAAARLAESAESENF